MRRLYYLLLAFQLSTSLVLAQITFTREWVAGKRSSGNPGGGAVLALHPNQQLISPCQTLWPAIEILMETEKVRQDHCGSLHIKSGKLLAKLKESLGKGNNKSPSQDEEILAFEEESKNP